MILVKKRLLSCSSRLPTGREENLSARFLSQSLDQDALDRRHTEKAPKSPKTGGANVLDNHQAR